MIDVLPVRTPTVPPATHTNCYRVGRTLIDPASPWPEEQARLAAWAGPVERILLTHHHVDHIGGVADLVARTGVPVWAHRDARVPFPVERRLGEGDVVDTGAGLLTCLYTPGHADGHLCFQLGDDVIAGDMVAGVGTIVLLPLEGDLAVYLASLERLVPIACTLHPAHGPAIPDGPGLLRQYIAHRHMRTAQIWDALAGRGPRTPRQVAETVYAGIPGVDLGLASCQVMTHLRWLLARGEVREAGTDLWEAE